MTASYTINAQGVTWAAGKNMLALVNHTGSGVVVDVYRIWATSLQTTGVTGGTCLLELWQCNSVASYTGGTAQTFILHDTASAAVPSQVIANAGTTTSLTRNSLVRRFTRYTEEFAVSDTAMEALGFHFPLNCLWDTGYGDSNIQPFRLRVGEGLVLFTPSSGGGTYTGSTDITIEMTIA
jgi:hypothetical protein